MTPRSLGIVGGSVVAGIVGGVLSTLIQRQMFDHALYGRGVVTSVLSIVITVLGSLGFVLAVFAAVATRVPFVGVGCAAACAVVLFFVRPLILGVGPTVDGKALLFLALFVLSLLGIDLVVLGCAGRPLPLAAAIGGAVAVAVAGIVIEVVQQLVYQLRLADLFRAHQFVFDDFVLVPILFVLAGVAGWVVRRPEPTSSPGVG